MAANYQSNTCKGCSAAGPWRTSTKLSAFFALFLHITILHGLSIDKRSSPIIPSSAKNPTLPPSVNLTAGRPWPDTPWNQPFFYDECAIRFITYGPERPSLYPENVVQAFDAIIYKLLQTRKEHFSPRDLPLTILYGSVNLRITWLEEFSVNKVALMLGVMRDLMTGVFEPPRDIRRADFGWKVPEWTVVGTIDIKIRDMTPIQAAVTED